GAMQAVYGGIISVAALISATLISVGASLGQTYPARPVRVIVPYGPGGPTDVIARLVSQKLSENLGQQFYTENLPGAGGNNGTGTAAESPPDGYTMIVVSTGF